MVEVTDTGIGLEPGAAERIFTPFEQADATIAGEFGGLGLGLSIARATVEAHGGELRVSSPGRNQGATFTVSLPCEQFLVIRRRLRRWIMPGDDSVGRGWFSQTPTPHGANTPPT